MRPYHEVVASLKNIYLEDSYVLSCAETPSSLRFDLLAVLTEDHEQYERPLPGERYCYKTAALIFSGDLKTDWLRKNFEAAKSVDPDGSVDFGQVDVFRAQGDQYYLEGRWGCALVNCQQIDFALTE